MGSGSLQLASLNSLTTTIAGQNTMAISGPNITIGGGAQASQINIGNTNASNCGLTSRTTTVTGTNRLNLLSNSYLEIDASATVLLSGQTIHVGTGTGNTNVNIGTGTGNSNVKIGNTNAGSNGSLTSETLQVTGTDRLNLYSTPGSKGIYIGQSSDKIGFFGQTPVVRPPVKLPTNYLTLANTATTAQIVDAIKNNGEAIYCLLRALDPNTNGLGLTQAPNANLTC
jgi:hypothetical protein